MKGERILFELLKLLKWDGSSSGGEYVRNFEFSRLKKINGKWAVLGLETIPGSYSDLVWEAKEA